MGRWCGWAVVWRRAKAADAPRVKRPALIGSIVLGANLVALPRQSRSVRTPAPVPAPRVCTPSPGTARLSPRWALVVGDTANDLHAAELLSSELAARFGWRPRLAAKAG